MCGIIGVIGPLSSNNPSWASYEVYSALLTLQHRGQDGAGILSYDPSLQKFFHQKDLGLVTEVFNREKVHHLKGNMAIGHTRYATAGSNEREDLQPLVSGFPFGVGMIHNGNILNYHSLAETLRDSSQQQLLTSNDLEILLNLWCHHLMNATPKGPFLFENATRAVQKIFETVIGSYSVIGTVANAGLFAFRDPQGFRPLLMGKKKGISGDQYCFSSETVALQFLGYEVLRNLAPGEFVFVHQNGQVQETIIPAPNRQKAHCMFEWVYFSAAESSLENRSVYSVRLKLGHLLGKKAKQILTNPLPDIVVPVPDTSRPAAIALSEELNIPFREALIKNRYIYRSFILNSQAERERIVELKLSPVKSEIENKHLLLVDDSIVRGTTSKKIIALLKKNGAQRVTLASTCPPIQYPCYYGIDFPTEKELIANGKNTQEIAHLIGAEQLIYLDIEDLKTAIGMSDLCMACLNKNYPTPVEEGHFFGLKRRGQI